MSGAIPPFLQYAFMAWCLVKHRDNFTLPLSILAVGPNQLPTQWMPGVKLPGRESDHLYPTSAEVKNAWNYTSTPRNVFMA
jgi:hypothetical protein